MYEDTIAAISTPIGEGGIGIIRLSGERSGEIVSRIFEGDVKNGCIVYGHIADPQNGEIVDEVLVSYMPAPHSYTRENVVEINCHGGPAPLQRILGLCLREGARSAIPGEFTLRAFLNGRIDLAQAEAVLDIIQAKTEASLRIAVKGLKGRLSSELGAVRQELMTCLANITARIDFPEDEVEEIDLISHLTGSLQHLNRLIEDAEAGIVYRQGVRTAIVGRPNVGKSSLLNILLGENRAIVTPVPGTTRDTVEETVNINGVPFVLIDTAGITHTRELVESLGIERSRAAIEKADLVLMVVDTSEPLQEGDSEIFSLLNGKEVILVGNKSDLPSSRSGIGLSRLTWPSVATSALTGAGIEDVKDSMVRAALGGKTVASDALLVSNPRHKEALERARGHIEEAMDGLKTGVPEDLVTIDLTAALNALGEITGETVQEELLNTIFSRFCVGK